MFAGFAGFLAGFAAAGAAAMVIAYLLFFGDSPRIDVSRPTVVQHIQQLQRLETVVYNMEKIVSGGQDNKYLPRMLAGDRILLIVHGEVTAGVDLGALDPSQLSIDGKSVAIRLPEATVFSTRLDNARTRVYTRETGLFSSPDPELESDVRRESERQLTPSRARWRDPEGRRRQCANHLDEPVAGAWFRGGYLPVIARSRSGVQGVAVSTTPVRFHPRQENR